MDCRFESNMSVVSSIIECKSIRLISNRKNQHRHFNTRLNELKTSSAQTSHPAAPLGYKHLYLVDSFYPSDDLRGEKIRVTREEKTGVVTQCVRKIRLGNLDIYSPKRAADWRVSVNLEVPGT